ncbi:MAG: TIGR03435 family protein [Bryobacteraceae bacterium]
MSDSLRSAVAAFVVVAGGMFAQSMATRPSFAEFEVASIKPTAPGAAGRWIRMQSTHEFAAKNHTLKTLIAAAYNLNPTAISGGPAWVDSDRYDIVAKAPNEVRPNLDEQMSMLRKLLADRFQLTFHREQKELRVYALTIAKGGPKLRESTVSADASPEGPPPLISVVSPQLVRLPGRNATMAELASVMQRAVLDYPVLDKTGLSARYDFDLEFTPDDTVFGGVLGKGPDDSAKPGLYAAISQQLGLRLEATRGPVETLVIDHVEHPSEN